MPSVGLLHTKLLINAKTETNKYRKDEEMLFLHNLMPQYNFKNNIYTGLRLDYILMQHNSSNAYNNPHNPVLNNVKVGIEAGYRF